MDLDAVSDILRKEAKALFFAKVARDIRNARKEKRPMRKKEEFIRIYREYLKRYNTYAQKWKVPLGFILYREVSLANYWWMNALSGYHCQAGKPIRATLLYVGELWGEETPPIPEQVEILKRLLREPSGIPSL